MPQGKPQFANKENFWDNVPNKPFEGCWNWNGVTAWKGYGLFSGGRSGPNGLGHIASRLAYADTYGIVNRADMPECVCHHCDNPLCVRPTHLFAGTFNDNNQDMILKGRARGRWGKYLGRRVAKIKKSSFLANA